MTSLGFHRIQMLHLICVSYYFKFHSRLFIIDEAEGGHAAARDCICWESTEQHRRRFYWWLNTIVGKKMCDTGKKLVSLQSGVHPKTSKRRPAWPLTSSGRMRTYWADTGVPSSWVSGLFLSNEPGKNCKSRRSWMTTCSSYFSSIFIFQRFVNWVWNILQIINKEKKIDVCTL